MVSVLTSLRAEERDAALERYAILQPHIEHDVPLAQLALDHDVTPQTLRRWLHAYRTHGLPGLAPKSRVDRGQRRLPAELLDLIRSTALQSPYASIADIHRAVGAAAVQRDFTAPSYATVHGIVQELSAERNLIALERIAATEGQAALPFDAQCPNERWLADHVTLDVQIMTSTLEPVQPTLTVIMDDYSRAVVGYYLGMETPSTQTTALALYHAIQPKTRADWPMQGLPTTFAIDHPAPDTHADLTQFCAHVGITLQFALPSVPAGRGKLEHLFESMQAQCLQPLASADPSATASVDLPTLTNHIAQFFSHYHDTPHPATRQPPGPCWQHAIADLKPAPATDDLDVLLRSELRRVHQDGIYLDGHRYFAPLLVDHLGTTVTVRFHPATPDHVRVYTERQFIGVAARLEAQEAVPTHPSLQEYAHRLRTRAQHLVPRQRIIPPDAELVVLLEHFRPTTAYQQFAALCDHCRTERSIGLCYGPPGTGKTWAARVYWARATGQAGDTFVDVGQKETVGYVSWQRAQRNVTPSLETVLKPVAHTWAELVIIDNSEYMSRHELRTLLEYWMGGTFGLVLVGRPALMVQSVEHPAFHRHISACQVLPLLTREECEQWVYQWYHQRVTEQHPAKLDPDAVQTIVDVSQGTITDVMEVLQALERGLSSGAYAQLSRATILQAVDDIIAAPINDPENTSGNHDRSLKG